MNYLLNRSDRVSGITNSKLQIIHQDHPQKDNIDLFGEVCFPNIQLESNIINFGSILSETSKKVQFNIKNISQMGLNYEWTFLEDEVFIKLFL